MKCARAILALLGFLGASSLAHAECLTTSFEFTDRSGEFSLGSPPATATFTGGQAKSVGNFSLYRTGFNSWMVNAGDTGVITFATPATEIHLWFKDQSAAVNSVLTIFDTSDGVIDTADGSTGSFREVSLQVVKGNPIGRITLVNNSATTGYAVIDDFSFCAVAAGPSPIEDPIPESIPRGDIAVRLEVVATGLTAPNWGATAPGDPGRLFVTDQNGIFWAIDLATGDKTVFLDVASRLVPLGIGGPNTFDERGLVGVAFHPDYAANGLLYTYTSEPAAGAADFSTLPPGESPNHQSVLTEWHVADPLNPAPVTDPASARVLLRIDEPQFNHDGGALNFGPDGFLYLSLGDGGAADDQGTGHSPGGNGQDASNPLGALLRIDPNGSNSANGQYGIPSDNPFAGVPGFAGEIFASGFRNPFRFSFDRMSGDLFLADVGQNDIEEIDLVTAGGNYGWRFTEGTFFFDPNDTGDGFVTDVDPGVPPGLRAPIAEYDHDEGSAIIGGFVYRGDAIPALKGRYVFGDFARSFNNDGRLFYLGEQNQVLEFQLTGQAELGMSLLGFGQDAEGELYVLANGTGVPFGDTGMVLRIAPLPADANCDGAITAADLTALLRLIAAGERAPCRLDDFNEDGFLDARDLFGVVEAIF